MIRVTRINGTSMVLNCDLIEQIQMVPDTMIALTNGKSFLVRESADQIIDLVIEFRHRTLTPGTFEPPTTERSGAPPR